jgi:uncharacterized RDD family membrane protein YckC
MAILIVNSILETLIGRSFGKLITGLQVIDNQGDYPVLLKSIIRNFLLFFGIILIFAIGHSPIDFYHNKKTKTYTIYSKNKKNIITQLKNMIFK